ALRQGEEPGAGLGAEQHRRACGAGDTGAHDVNKGLIRAATGAVDVTRDGLAPGSGLPADQNGCVGRGRRGRLVTQLSGRLAVPQDLGVPRELVEERAVALFEAALAERVSEYEQGLLEGQRLFDEIERAELRRFDGRFDRAVTGDHHDLRVDAL